MTKRQKIAYYVLLVLVSGLFVFSGVPKLLAQPVAVQSFAVAGLPVWFMYFIGVGEVLGAICLWSKPFFRWAYTGLFFVLLGATYVSAVYVGLLTALFPLVVAAFLTTIVWLRGRRTPSASSASTK